MERIEYGEIGIDQLEEYGKIPFYYNTKQKYELKKIEDGLGGILLELIEVPDFCKDFGTRVESWKEIFDLKNWKFYAAYNGERKMIAGCTLATKTPNCYMLEGREDLAILWDIRVSDKYKHQGIGQTLFDMAKKYAKGNGFKQLKVECQNTNPAAVKFYHKQGMKLCAINEYAYADAPNEVQLLWYLDL
ncbi:MAG: GNAT family N-acetyltransferase [Clostridia bacterium]|nr:GNAT family N-acetyltransferase [Clostridia bacterium]MBR2290124.1 GNAT family N-acetyltransferase [Clostridia bacterium]